MEKSKDRPLYSCVLDMNLAAYYSSNDRVRRIAKDCMLQVSKSNKTALKKIVKSRNPSRLVHIVFLEISPKAKEVLAAHAA